MARAASANAGRRLRPRPHQINDNALNAGFTVTLQVIKQSRAVVGVRFLLTKVNARLEFEHQLREAGQEPARAPPRVEAIRPSPADYERAQAAAPRWDIDELERQWREWIAAKPSPANPGGAFVAFCRKKARRVE